MARCFTLTLPWPSANALAGWRLHGSLWERGPVELITKRRYEGDPLAIMDDIRLSVVYKMITCWVTGLEKSPGCFSSFQCSAEIPTSDTSFLFRMALQRTQRRFGVTLDRIRRGRDETQSCNSGQPARLRR